VALAQPLRVQDRVSLRRQLVIGNFIVDFACTKVRLVVEVDGGYHEGRQRRDAARDRALNALGWRVLRFEEEEVFANPDGVIARITAFRTRLKVSDTSTSTLL